MGRSRAATRHHSAAVTGAADFVDQIANKRGIDPVKYRLDLLVKTPRAHKVLERVAQMADWGRAREGRGLGAAYIDYSDTRVGVVVEISIDRGAGKIKLHNVWCAIDCSVAVQPDNVIAQTESSIVYGIGLALTNASASRMARSNSRISTTTSHRATAMCRRCMSR
jgi:CO/xanthine dehydrogenase Mo-binding subunit